MAEMMNVSQAQRTIRRYVCSDCWEDLREFEYDSATRTSIVRCSTENCPCNGYVSRRYVEIRQAESFGELANARIVLRDAIPWIRGDAKTTTQLLKELGF